MFNNLYCEINEAYGNNYNAFNKKPENFKNDEINKNYIDAQGNNQYNDYYNNNDFFDENNHYNDNSTFETIKTYDTIRTDDLTFDNFKKKRHKHHKNKKRHKRHRKHKRHSYYVTNFIKNFIIPSNTNNTIYDSDIYSYMSSVEDISTLDDDTKEIYLHVLNCNICKNDINDKFKKLANIDNNTTSISNSSKPLLQPINIGYEFKELLMIMMAGLFIIIVLDFMAKLGNRL